MYFDRTLLHHIDVHDKCLCKQTNMLCSTVVHVHAGGALGGDVLHAAEPWGLGLSWGDANVTGAIFLKLYIYNIIYKCFSMWHDSCLNC